MKDTTKKLSQCPPFCGDVDELRCVLDHMPAMIGLWDRDLRNRFANGAYLEWFGIDPAKIPGMHLREVIGDERYELNLPYIERALRGDAQTFERAIPTPDGLGVRYSLANYIPYVRDGAVQGFFALVSDVTPLKEAEAALRASEERHRAVVEDQTEIISRFLPDGRTTFVNDAYCKFVGKSVAELVGSPWQPAVHPDDVPHVEARLRELGRDNPTVRIEKRIYAADGRMHWMQFVNRGLFDADGRLVEIQAVGHDISDLKRVEVELRAAQDQLELRVLQRTEQLRKLSVEATLAEERERQAIARDLHDGIGQILHIARLRIDWIARTAPSSVSADLAELRELIVEASAQARSLTGQLSPPVLRKLGLVPALRWLAGEIARQYGLSIDDDIAAAEVNDDLAILTPAQAQILFRATRELLINVARHARATRARLSACRDGRDFVIAVEDDGIGMPSCTENVEGFGLFNVRERVLHLGGITSIEAPPAGGTRVVIRLPLHPGQSGGNAS